MSTFDLGLGLDGCDVEFAGGVSRGKDGKVRRSLWFDGAFA
jgi:hypothetical protein